MNKNDKRRREILNIKSYGYGSGGIIMINDVTLEQIMTLKNEHFLKMSTRQGEGPTITKFVKFLKNHPNFYLGGYIITPDRYDYRVCFDSIVGYDCSDEDMKDFKKEFKNGSDEFKCNEYSCKAWWD